MKGALARHDVILRDVVAGHGGQVVKTTGDGLHARSRWRRMLWQLGSTRSAG
jgi:hypothetical protein